MNALAQNPSDDARVRSTTWLWLVTMLAVFALMIVLGISLRLAQGGKLALEPNVFYAWMTMHALGMVGALFSAGLAVIWAITRRYATPSIGLMRVTLVMVVLGAAGLLVATLIGNFGPGWYALYPLPFVNPVWPNWSIGLAISSLMVLGVAWLLIQLEILRALGAAYGLRRMLGWQYFAKDPGEPTPPSVLIVTVCAVAGSLGTISGAATLMMYFIKWLSPAADIDALLLKNTMFMFGHTIVNIAMYCGIALVYEYLPSYTQRPWKTNRLVAAAWNATMLLVLFAYFHHLYMDFVQPASMQTIGQIASYFSAIPATAVTVFGVMSQVFRSGVTWSFTPLAFFLGILGWVIGGLAAVVDATIAVNIHFHNTLWVPAHFHTYFLLGFVLILLGYVHRLSASGAQRLAAASLVTMLAGGWGFVTMFYLGGVHSVPRRFADYEAISFGDVAEVGGDLALGGGLFASVFLLGVLGFYFSAWRGRGRAAA